MENPITELKKELIGWIRNLDDLKIMQSVLDLKNADQLNSMVADNPVEYAVKDDFDERFSKGVNPEEARKRTRAFIESLPWER